METVRDFIFLGSKITVDSDGSHEIKRHLLLGRKARQYIKSQRHHFADKHSYNQRYGFSSRYVWMWELDQKEGWALKNWCFQTVVLKKTLGSLLDSKEIKPVSRKGNEPWIFIGRTDAKTPIICPPDANSRLIRKDPDAGKDWGQEKRAGRRGWKLDSITDSMLFDMSLNKLQEIVKDREDWRAAVRGVAKNQTGFSDWTTNNKDDTIS